MHLALACVFRIGRLEVRVLLGMLLLLLARQWGKRARSEHVALLGMLLLHQLLLLKLI